MPVVGLMAFDNDIWVTYLMTSYFFYYCNYYNYNYNYNYKLVIIVLLLVVLLILLSLLLLLFLLYNKVTERMKYD